MKLKKLTKWYKNIGQDVYRAKQTKKVYQMLLNQGFLFEFNKKSINRLQEIAMSKKPIRLGKTEWTTIKKQHLVLKRLSTKIDQGSINTTTTKGKKELNWIIRKQKEITKWTGSKLKTILRKITEKQRKSGWSPLEKEFYRQLTHGEKTKLGMPEYHRALAKERGYLLKKYYDQFKIKHPPGQTPKIRELINQGKISEKQLSEKALNIEAQKRVLFGSKTIKKAINLLDDGTGEFKGLPPTKLLRYILEKEKN